MKVREIHASFSFTKNLGNYQSLRVEASATSELEPGENVEEAFEEAFELVKAQVRKEARKSAVTKEV